jgi:NifU-like protein involved in Fe-S cluster formation
MQQKHFLTAKGRGLLADLAVLILTALFTLAGCPTTKASAKTVGDEVGNSAVDEATDAVSDNVREEVRESVNDAFKGIFKK